MATDTRTDWITKVRQLKATADSFTKTGNPAAASVYQAKVDELIAKFGITNEELNGPESRRSQSFEDIIRQYQEKARQDAARAEYERQQREQQSSSYNQYSYGYYDTDPQPGRAQSKKSTRKSGGVQTEKNWFNRGYSVGRRNGPRVAPERPEDMTEGQYYWLSAAWLKGYDAGVRFNHRNSW